MPSCVSRFLSPNLKNSSQTRSAMARNSPWPAIKNYTRRYCPLFLIQSAHLATAPLAHGVIGTDEVEFLGDPSMIRSL